jgi:formate hydrogenlyase subunit 3/multisubunit Na+/H+ antiporter MnhD subunit
MASGFAAVRVVTWSGCAFGAALALAALGGGLSGSIAVPFGPNGGLHLAIDALSALFLLILCISGAVAALECEAPLLPVALGALAFVLLAADGFTFVMAFGLASAATWALDLRTRPGLAQAACSTLFPAAAILLLASQDAGLDLRFAAMRDAPPEGARAVAVLLLTLLGAGSRLVWPSRSNAVGALLSQSMAAVAVYTLVRVLFDLCGAAVPRGWGVLLLVLGAAAAVLGGLRANAEDDLLAILAACRMGAAGLIAAGLGVALAARGSDLTPLAALALAAALLHATNYAVFDVLLVSCMAAVSRGAGTWALSQLGGLMRTMPGVGLAVLAGAACLAGLPLTAGFTGRWLLVQSLLADQRPGGFWLQLCFALVLTAVALGAALAAAAAIRLIGIGFLGRPRTPGAAAASDAPRQVRLVMAGLAACCVLLGLWPSAALALVQPALQQLLGMGIEERGPLAISPQVDSPGYVAPGLAAVLAVSGVAAVWAVSRLAGPDARGARRVPTGTGGQAGDPAMQISAASAGQALLQNLASFAKWPSLTRGARAARQRIGGLTSAKSAVALLLLAGLLLWAAV